jgi:hypothetical protein
MDAGTSRMFYPPSIREGPYNSEERMIYRAGDADMREYIEQMGFYRLFKWITMREHFYCDMGD